MIAAHLHHDYAGFEFSFGRAFEKLINFFLNLLTDLLLSTFLAYRAGDILDFNEVGLHCRSAQISPRAALWAISLAQDLMQRQLGFVAIAQKRRVRVCAQGLTEGKINLILEPFGL
jgi:hypothetical protein